MHLHCKKCLGSRTGDILGEPCQTPGCDGIIEEQPPFDSLVDALPEEFYCPRREENSVAARVFPGPDNWNRFKSNGDRVCSYCGSLHWEDMLRLVCVAATAPEEANYHSVPSIEPSDKAYKIYVHQPRVRNAMEGGIKFYTQHIPRDQNGKMVVTEDQQSEYAKAAKLSRKRFDRYLADKYPRK